MLRTKRRTGHSTYKQGVGTQRNHRLGPPRNAYFARGVMNEMCAAGDDSTFLSELYSGVRDESDVLFPVYLNPENKKYTASRDSECLLA